VLLFFSLFFSFIHWLLCYSVTKHARHYVAVKHRSIRDNTSWRWPHYDELLQPSWRSVVKAGCYGRHAGVPYATRSSSVYFYRSIMNRWHVDCLLVETNRLMYWRRTLAVVRLCKNWGYTVHTTTDPSARIHCLHRLGLINMLMLNFCMNNAWFKLILCNIIQFLSFPR